MDELRMFDYIMSPLSVIRKHPSFSLDAWNKMMALLDLTTTQLEQLDITGVTNG